MGWKFKKQRYNLKFLLKMHLNPSHSIELFFEKSVVSKMFKMLVKVLRFLIKKLREGLRRGKSVTKYSNRNEHLKMNLDQIQTSIV